MNAFLAQSYQTQEKIAAAAAQDAGSELEKTAEAVLLTELEKVAAAMGVDLNDLSDEDIADIVGAASQALDGVGEAGAEKTAGAEYEPSQAEVEADYLGRVMAHAQFDEASKIQAAQQQQQYQEKTASAEDIEMFEALAMQRANAIINALMGDGDDFIKEASMDFGDNEELDDALTERAAEILEYNGYDADAIADDIFAAA